MKILDILVTYLTWWNVFVFVLTIAVCCVVAYMSYLHYIHGKYDHIPGPPRDNFFMGNGPSFLKEMSTNNSFFQQYLLKLTKQYGKTFKLMMLHNPFVITSDPEAVKDLLVTGHHPKIKKALNPTCYLWGERFIGNGIVAENDHKKWAFRRALLNPCFQKSYLRRLTSEFNVCADALMNKLAEKADGVTKFSLLLDFHHVTLDALGKISFGLDINSLETENSEFTQAILMTLKGFSKKIKGPLFFTLNPLNWKFIWDVRKACRFLRQFGDKVLNDRIEAKKRGEYLPPDLLTHIVKVKEENPDIEKEDILDDFITFFVAGQETSANLLGFVIEFLGRNPDILKRLKDEIDDVVGEKAMIEFSDLDRLVYLDMVVKETLRLASPASITFREVHKDNHVIGGYKVPKNTIVIISHFISTRLEEYYTDPEKFDPERFSPEAKERRNTYTYFSFTIGPRTCIGKHFADIEAKIIIVKFIQRFDFQLDTSRPLELEEVTMIRPKGGVMCSLSMREHT